MTLTDIQECIAELSTEELETLLRDIRHNRTKETILITKVKEKKDAVSKMMDNLTPEQIQALIATLGG